MILTCILVFGAALFCVIVYLLMPTRGLRNTMVPPRSAVPGALDQVEPVKSSASVEVTPRSTEQDAMIAESASFWSYRPMHLCLPDLPTPCFQRPFGVVEVASLPFPTSMVSPADCYHLIRK